MCKVLHILLTFACTQTIPILAVKEVFNSEHLAKVRAGESFTLSTLRDITAKNIGFVWRVTQATSLKPHRHFTKDEIFKELVFSFSDQQFRSNWFTAMRTGWQNCLRELRVAGPGPFMKKHSMDDKLFVGKAGEERWKEVVDYLKAFTEDEKMNFISKVAENVEAKG